VTLRIYSEGGGGDYRWKGAGGKIGREKKEQAKLDKGRRDCPSWEKTTGKRKRNPAERKREIERGGRKRGKRTSLHLVEGTSENQGTRGAVRKGKDWQSAKKKLKTTSQDVLKRRR